MERFKANFETRSRDDIMLVSEMLAKALKPYINQGVSILIFGEEDGGKSAVVDGITAACMDNGPVFLPKSLVEDEPDDAIAGVKKIFQMNSGSAFVTFNRNLSNWRECIQNRQPGIHFLTSNMYAQSHRKPPPDDADINIFFNQQYGDNALTSLFDGDLEPADQAWLRSWKIEVKNPDLQCAEMSETLEMLQIYFREEVLNEHLIFQDGMHVS